MRVTALSVATMALVLALALAMPVAAKDPVLPGGPGGDSPIDENFAGSVRDHFDRTVTVYTTGLAVAGVTFAGFALVTRYISPKEALKNPQRSMLYGFIRGNPGVHLKKLGDEFSLKTSSILWHIRKLESAELVRSDRANGYRVFYPTEGGAQMKAVSRALSALHNENALRIFEHLDAHPGIGTPEMAKELGIHAGTVRWHLRKLQEFGLAEELDRDGTIYIFPTTLGHKALQTIMKAPGGVQAGLAAVTA